MSAKEANQKIPIDNAWKDHLIEEFESDYMRTLSQFLKTRQKAGKKIFPKGPEIFSAFNLTPWEKVRVVILGQDPYHGPNQAHGLSFSVKPGVDIPPSLQNIYKELKSDLGIEPAKHGFLQHWAEQGVLLLNATLTVEAGQAGSHQKKGWEQFTDKVIHLLNKEKTGLVFVLWGSYAQKKGEFIDTTKHLVIKSPHPSPLSSHRGFFGSKPFSKINKYLESQGQSPIDWQLPALLKTMH